MDDDWPEDVHVPCICCICGADWNLGQWSTDCPKCDEALRIEDARQEEFGTT